MEPDSAAFPLFSAAALLHRQTSDLEGLVDTGGKE